MNLTTQTFINAAGATKHRLGFGTGADSSNGFGSVIIGLDIHDAPVTANPVLMGGFASAAAPADVSGDGDAVRTWYLRNGAQAMVLTAAGALIPGDATNGLKVDVTRIGGQTLTFGAGAVAAGTARHTLASDDPAVVSLAIIDDWDESDRCKVNPITGQAGVQGGSGVVSANTQRVVLATDVPLPAGTNAIGKLAANPGVTIGAVQVVAAASGGYTPATYVSTASTNATSLKGSAGTLGWLNVGNTNASPRWLKLFDKATAPSMGSDVPCLNIMIPGNTQGGGISIPLPQSGIEFTTGIAFGLSTGVPLTDNNAVAVNEITLNFGYK